MTPFSSATSGTTLVTRNNSEDPPRVEEVRRSPKKLSPVTGVCWPI